MVNQFTYEQKMILNLEKKNKFPTKEVDQENSNAWRVNSVKISFVV